MSESGQMAGEWSESSPSDLSAKAALSMGDVWKERMPNAGQAKTNRGKCRSSAKMGTKSVHATQKLNSPSARIATTSHSLL